MLVLAAFNNQAARRIVKLSDERRLYRDSFNSNCPEGAGIGSHELACVGIEQLYQAALVFPHGHASRSE